MKVDQLDDDGLPKLGSKNPEGMFNARFDGETWDMIRQLNVLWEAEKKTRLTFKDVVRACVIRTYKNTLKNANVAHANDLPDLPLTPIELLEERVKQQHEKAPKPRRRTKNVDQR